MCHIICDRYIILFSINSIQQSRLSQRNISEPSPKDSSFRCTCRSKVIWKTSPTCEVAPSGVAGHWRNGWFF